MPVAIHPAMTNYHPAQPALTARAAAVAGSIGRLLGLWRARIKERHAFPSLVDERDLRDMGITWWQVQEELRKPFWRG